MKNRIEGKIIITSLGTGYVTDKNGKEEVYIPSYFTNTALNGDEVEVAITPRVNGDKIRGEVTKIISRRKMDFVGTVERKKGDSFAFIKADDYKIHLPFFVPSIDPNVKNKDKVLIRFVKWDDPKKNPTAKILKVLGQKGEIDVEMESIVFDRGFKVGFSNAAQKESKDIKRKQPHLTAKEIKRRKDFREKLTFTIDPDDAKDFDDAISFEEIDQNTFEVGIHIADVSFWVKEKSAIDNEAIKQGFSIYLVDRTIPMLPEILSNDICSLNPDEDKLTFSAIFKIRNGKVIDRWFGKTVIRSDRRYTYREAQEIIDDLKPDPHSAELKTLMNITRSLRKDRINSGAIEFSCNEVKIEIDSKGRPTKIYVEKGIESQKLIEDLMILANREAAYFIGGEKSNNLSLYRIHEKPDKDSLDELFTFLKKLGHQIKFSGKTATSKQLNDLIKDIAGTDIEFMVKSTIIRSLPKAIYSTSNRGHFAMALKHYTHFTSPIRRYADLLTHRLLEKKLEKKSPSQGERDFCKRTAEKLSQIEINLASAERASIALKQTEYMLNRKGEIRDGVISAVTEWGIYVQDIETQAEGLVRLRDLKGDFYLLDKENFSISGRKTKKRYSLGDRVKVKVVGGDLERKSLEYLFA